jgi:RimJ/RimL family protein N-acetyltransferase
VATRFETERLVVRSFEARDGDAWVAMFGDPEVTRFLPEAPRTRKTFATALSARHAMEAELGYAVWAIEEKAGGAFIGQCGLRPAAAMDPSAGSEIDLAYHFARASWNKGYATEAVVAVLAYGLDRPGWIARWRWRYPRTLGLGASWRRPECATKGRPPITAWRG